MPLTGPTVITRYIALVSAHTLDVVAERLGLETANQLEKAPDAIGCCDD